MPLKLNTGIARKVGQPNFGSIQASCFLEIELTSDVIHDYDRFQQQVRQAFHACEQAVEEQLADSQQPVEHSTNGHNSNRHNGNGNGSDSNGSVRGATQSQIRAINAIAGKQRIDITSFLLNRHGCKAVDSLTIKQASDVIDQLKSSQNGNGVGR